jgi:large subunit ribosomal protein L33
MVRKGSRVRVPVSAPGSAINQKIDRRPKGIIMAGKKGKVQHAIMECSVCHNRNYKTQRNVTTVQSKLVLKKYCSHCKKHNEHKETK